VAPSRAGRCSFRGFEGSGVVFRIGTTDGNKLGPVGFTGEAIDSASAVYNAGSSALSGGVEIAST
jgi:hypothetical protein